SPGLGVDRHYTGEHVWRNAIDDSEVGSLCVELDPIDARHLQSRHNGIDRRRADRRPPYDIKQTPLKPRGSRFRIWIERGGAEGRASQIEADLGRLPLGSHGLVQDDRAVEASHFVLMELPEVRVEPDVKAL